VTHLRSRVGTPSLARLGFPEPEAPRPLSTWRLKEPASSPMPVALPSRAVPECSRAPLLLSSEEPAQGRSCVHRMLAPLPEPVVVCSSALADRARWHRCHRAVCTASPEATPHVPTSPSTSLGQSACHRAGRLPAERANTQRLWTLPRGMAPAHPAGSRPLGSRPVSRPSQARPIHTAAFGAAKLRRSGGIAATPRPCSSRVLGECRVVPAPTPVRQRPKRLPPWRARAVGRPIAPKGSVAFKNPHTVAAATTCTPNPGLPPYVAPLDRPLFGSVGLA